MIERHQPTPTCSASGCAGGPEVEPEWGSRRDFLKFGVAAVAGGLLTGCEQDQAFLDKHFRELTPAELEERIAKLKADYKEKYGKDFEIHTDGPLPETLFAYGLDLSRCIGCRRCVYACVGENNQSRHDPQIHWIRVLEMEKSRGVDLHHANHYYDPEQVPREGHFYMPVQCQQCENSPCTRVCPVQATWREPDGIVVIDYNWCIGCRFCMAACPYDARHFNWADPQIPTEEINTTTHYLGNRPRYRGVVEKCTFCIQRSRRGRYPACVEICPVGARKFGNLLDPNSEIRRVMDQQRVFVLKEELNQGNKFFYFYSI